MFPKFFSRRISALVPVLLLLFPFSAQSQTEEEMAILSLYYRPEELQVISASRSLKSISQVAENISVITANEIRAMNAHTLGEVLQQIPGVFVASNQDFGAVAMNHIQGSELRHVQLIVDNIPWNYIAGGEPSIMAIPLGAVERIEIIKGPASSAWGSSLGGIIHVITKSAGHTIKPEGTLSASYGEAVSQDLRAEISGKMGDTGYYLFAGHQESDGLEQTLGYDDSSIFSKLRIPLWERTEIGLSFGHSQPLSNQIESSDMVSDLQDRVTWGNLNLETALSEEMEMRLSFYGLRHTFSTDLTSLGAGIISPTPDFLMSAEVEERTIGFTGNLTWESGIHRLVLGADANRVDLKNKTINGSYYQGYGFPPRAETDAKRDLWALYINDTMRLGDLSVIPGIRYDHHDFTGGFISPSLGLTYHWKNTLFRGTLSRGFGAPGLLMTQAGAYRLSPNPDLDYEKIWSFQIGAETEAIPYLWAKVNLFHHEIDDIFERVRRPGTTTIFENMKEDRRRGFEIEMETLPVYKFAFFGGFSYSYTDQDWEEDALERYKWIAGLRYKNPKIVNLRLNGIYTWWDKDSSSNASYDDPIWDINLSRDISIKKIRLSLFATIHNIFDGSSYSVDKFRNPDRWAEVGLRFHF